MMTIGDIKVPVLEERGYSGTDIRVFYDPETPLDTFFVNHIRGAGLIKYRVDKGAHLGRIAVEESKHLAQVPSKGPHEPEAIFLGTAVGSLVREDAAGFERFDPHFSDDSPPPEQFVRPFQFEGVLNEIITWTRIADKGSLFQPLSHEGRPGFVIPGGPGARSEDETYGVGRVPVHKPDMMIHVDHVVWRGDDEGEIADFLRVVSNSGKRLDLRQRKPPVGC